MVASGEQRGVRWLVMGDDDTVFFPENLAAVLGNVEQDVLHSYGMAFGGGGFAVSIPAAAELTPVLDSCLERYNHFYGSDQRVHACLSELGIPLTREPGFHQPISPRGRDRLEALGSLVRASRLDPARTLMQSICYEPTRGWSVSVAWGYTVQLYPKTWRSSQKGPFTFNTRPVPSEPCDRPILFFFDRITKQKIDSGGTVSEYSVHLPGNSSAACEHPDFAAASKVKLIEVYAPIMDPNDWKKAPRRHCCETETRRRPWWGRSSTMEVRISPCRPGETITKSPP
ncbi:unnamed protein product [Spirodela intermedia]|uniref:Uncharacterized protein n=1 Tax=Spirodela intermedia TaxID=51605 RepID=A0A7I8IBR4_SPIIN|nr:unnamed protein product [Spirodela intermedia]CAA6655028.1 unnamed protein product [Spirodela intermedia]